MTIGFDGSRAFSPDRTGTENYSYQLFKALAKIDKKNKYIVYIRGSASTSLSKYSLSEPEANRSAENDWPENFQFKVINFPRLWTQVGLAKQTFTDRLEVLFIPAHTSPLVHRPGLKTVVTVHDLGAEYLPKMHQLKQRLYLKWITNYQLKNATKLIAVSEATKKDLIEKVGIASNKIEVIYEGYNGQLYRPIHEDILVSSLKQFDLKKQEYFLFVGTIQPRKNLERLIKAFSVIASEASQSRLNKDSYVSGSSPDPRNDKVQLALVGNKGWLSDEIYALPKKLGIEKQVKFLGWVPDEKLPALYSGAIALTFPSLFEGFGLPILEAQASGCPVITSNISSMPEVAGKGAILVDPYSEKDILRGMTQLRQGFVGQRVIREKLIKLGRENVSRFSWDKAAMETLQTLQEVV